MNFAVGGKISARPRAARARLLPCGCLAASGAEMVTWCALSRAGVKGAVKRVVGQFEISESFCFPEVPRSRRFHFG